MALTRGTGNKSNYIVPEDSWPLTVIKVGNWYSDNIHTFLGNTTGGRSGGTLSRGYYGYPSGKVPQLSTDIRARDDCSGFVSCCLLAFGAIPINGYLSNDDAINPNGPAGKLYKEAGFNPLPYDKSKLLPFDIVVKCYKDKNGKRVSHTEVIGKISSTLLERWNWGGINDGIWKTASGKVRSKNPTMASISSYPNDYKLIWRHGGITSEMLSNLNYSAIDMSGVLSGSGSMSAEALEVLAEYFEHGLNMAHTSKAYYHNDKYDWFKNDYGNLFSETNSNLNRLIQSAYNIVEPNDTSNYIHQKDNIQGRVYSTNDAKIVLDELSLPVSYKNDAYISSEHKLSNREILQSNYDKAEMKDFTENKIENPKTEENNLTNQTDQNQTNSN